MKQKYVPIEKQSKKKQKEFHAAQRKTWGSMCPVTRKVPNLKAYNRKKSKFRYGHERNLDFCILLNFPTCNIQKILIFPHPALQRRHF